MQKSLSEEIVAPAQQALSYNIKPGKNFIVNNYESLVWHLVSMSPLFYWQFSTTKINEND